MVAAWLGCIEAASANSAAEIAMPLRMILFPASATYTLPAVSTATPIGELNWVALPVAEGVALCVAVGLGVAVLVAVMDRVIRGVALAVLVALAVGEAPHGGRLVRRDGRSAAGPPNGVGRGRMGKLACNRLQPRAIAVAMSLSAYAAQRRRR